MAHLENAPESPFRAAAIRAARETAIALQARLDGLRSHGVADGDAGLHLLVDVLEAADQFAVRVPELAETHGKWALAFSGTTSEPTRRRARAAVVHLELLIRAATRSRFVDDDLVVRR